MVGRSLLFLLFLSISLAQDAPTVPATVPLRPTGVEGTPAIDPALPTTSSAATESTESSASSEIGTSTEATVTAESAPTVASRTPDETNPTVATTTAPAPTEATSTTAKPTAAAAANIATEDSEADALYLKSNEEVCAASRENIKLPTFVKKDRVEKRKEARKMMGIIAAVLYAIHGLFFAYILYLHIFSRSHNPNPAPINVNSAPEPKNVLSDGPPSMEPIEN